MHKDLQDVLKHVGVKGMKWGVRKADKKPKKQITVRTTKDTTQKKPTFGRGITSALAGTPLYIPVATAVGISSINRNKRARLQVADALGMSPKEFKRRDLKDAASIIQQFANVQLETEGRKVRMSQDLEDVLQHYGVKGMKWGVIRSTSAKAASKAGSAIKKSRVGEEVGSVKRQMAWKKALKDMDKLTTSELSQKTRRLQQENEFKRLAYKKEANYVGIKKNVATSKDRKDYRNRGKMTDAQLNEKLVRLRAKDSLISNVEKANKKQLEIGRKAVSIAAPVALSYAMGQKVGAADVVKAFNSNNNDFRSQMRDNIAKAAGEKTMAAVAKRQGL